MSALVKSSILPLLAIVIAVYLYSLSGGEDFDAVRPRPHKEICDQDQDRLARLQAKPSLDEAVRFGSELRCLKLWPQLLSILDSLSPTTGSAGVSNPSGPALGATSAGDASPPGSSSVEATSMTPDDACEHDKDRLAELQARPSFDDAMRFESELRCSRLQPQLLAMLKAIGDPAHLASPSPQDCGNLSEDASAETNAMNEVPPAPKAAPDADRRIATLERERDALAAEVGRLERRGDSPPVGQANSPRSRQPAVALERSDLEPSRAAVSLPDGMPARVLIHYLRNNEDVRLRAENLANALTAQGVQVADLRESAGAIRTELSFSYASDEAIALRVGRLAGVAPVRRAQPKDGLMASPGTVELSLSGDSHLAVITTSRKESNHE